MTHLVSQRLFQAVRNANTIRQPQNHLYTVSLSKYHLRVRVLRGSLTIMFHPRSATPSASAGDSHSAGLNRPLFDNKLYLRPPIKRSGFESDTAHCVIEIYCDLKKQGGHLCTRCVWTQAQISPRFHIPFIINYY